MLLSLFHIKDAPLLLILDLYEKTICPSIEEKSLPTYNEMIESLELCYRPVQGEDIVDFSHYPNDLNIAGSYLRMLGYREMDKALWIAYEALCMLKHCYPGFSWEKDRRHIFYYKEHPFIILFSDNRVLFFAPEKKETTHD